MATAESCTGGGIAQTLTDIPGSSSWFDRAFVTYSNESKSQMLGVPADTIKGHGAVSQEVVSAMTEGVLAVSSVDWVVAVSGIAGPGGGTVEKPVGTVWFCWQRRGHEPSAERMLFVGDRASIRSQAIDKALEGLINRLTELDL